MSYDDDDDGGGLSSLVEAGRGDRITKGWAVRPATLTKVSVAVKQAASPSSSSLAWLGIMCGGNAASSSFSRCSGSEVVDAVARTGDAAFIREGNRYEANESARAGGGGDREWGI